MRAGGRRNLFLFVVGDTDWVHGAGHAGVAGWEEGRRRGGSGRGSGSGSGGGGDGRWEDGGRAMVPSRNAMKRLCCWGQSRIQGEATGHRRPGETRAMEAATPRGPVFVLCIFVQVLHEVLRG
nr:hypothetical protein CFP56_23817 [Quercus suber]